MPGRTMEHFTVAGGEVVIMDEVLGEVARLVPTMTPPSVDGEVTGDVDFYTMTINPAWPKLRDVEAVRTVKSLAVGLDRARYLAQLMEGQDFA